VINLESSIGMAIEVGDATEAMGYHSHRNVEL
jgi:hypothetical protein